MSPSRAFILRPVTTALLMAAILIVGAAAYLKLPVSALPEVEYPTIQVRTFYPGASPDVMSSAVTAPLERQFGQIPGLTQMTSTSSDGSSTIVLQFALRLNIDVAEQEAVRDAVIAVGPLQNLKAGDLNPGGEEAGKIKEHFEILQGQLGHVQSLIEELDREYKKFLAAHPE